MASRKPIQVLQYTYPEQRLGDKTLFNTAIKKDGSTVRYFSGIDAEIYFGETYIDEAVQIQFSLQQNTMPLFGYNSYVYDQIAQGSRIIQGQFVVNFTKASYLYDVLNTLAAVKSGSSMNVVADQENTAGEQEAAAAKKSSQISISDHSPMWNKAFEICMSYGDAKISNVANSTMLLLTGVWLTGVSQSFGINGEPIYETYSFVARDVQFKPVLSGSVAVPKGKESEDVIVITDMSYSEYLDDSSKPFGQLTVCYQHHAIVEKVMFEPKLTLTSARGLVEISTETNANSGAVTYRVPAAWRAAIKKYCMDGLKDNPTKEDLKKVPSTFDANLSFKYTVNGASATKALSSKVRIFDVYSNL